MSEPYELFNKDAGIKTADSALQEKIAVARKRYNHAFDDAVTQFSNLETAKRRAAFSRWKALENLDKYLIEFEANFIKSGGKVIWAQSPAEACSEIIGIINRSGKKIVKSKSLTTEEIGLDETLILNKKEWTETDLGQYILQLSGEKPTHMVMPAVHKSKEDINILFSDKLNSKLNSEAENLSLIAAKQLREKYRDAEIGITGANFIVADIGGISITENEGNVLLACAKPDIHIVVAGIDKVIPSLSDLHVLLPLLSTYGTGQKITAYNSIIRGPRKTNETDGPVEMYVVLVDNGRTKVLSEELQRSICTCIRCGACLYSDPVYSIIGGQPYRSTWMGPPGTVILPHIHDSKTHGFFSQLSTLSAADTEVCPVNINFNKLILDNRKKAVDLQAKGTGEKIFYFLWKRAMLKRDIINLKGIKARNYFMNNIFFKSPSGLRNMKKHSRETFNEQWRRKMNGH